MASPRDTDALNVMGDFLRSQAAFVALLPGGLHVGATEPRNWNPTKGTALCVTIQGGRQSYARTHRRVSYLFRSYGGGSSEQARLFGAMAVLNSLDNVLNPSEDGAINHWLSQPERESEPTPVPTDDPNVAAARASYLITVTNLQGV